MFTKVLYADLRLIFTIWQFPFRKSWLISCCSTKFVYIYVGFSYNCV